MPSAFVKLLAITLILVQGVLALAPGRVLCLSIGGCEADAGAGMNASEHRTHGGCCGKETDESGPSGPFDLQSHPDDGCGCHVHVRVPRSEQVSNSGPSLDFVARAMPAPAVVADMGAWDIPTVAHWGQVHTPSESGLRAQQCALKATRLLI